MEHDGGSVASVGDGLTRMAGGGTKIASVKCKRGLAQMVGS